MSTPQFIHGKLGTISINGSLFNSTQFKFSEKVVGGLQDITYSQAGGATYQTMLPGYNGVSGSITFIYDVNNQPVIAPYDMIPGQLMTLILYPDGTKPYSFDAYSGQFDWGSGPKAGPVEVTVNFESTGTVSHPTS